MVWRGKVEKMLRSNVFKPSQRKEHLPVTLGLACSVEIILQSFHLGSQMEVYQYARHIGPSLQQRLHKRKSLSTLFTGAITSTFIAWRMATKFSVAMASMTARTWIGRQTWTSSIVGRQAWPECLSSMQAWENLRLLDTCHCEEDWLFHATSLRIWDRTGDLAPTTSRKRSSTTMFIQTSPDGAKVQVLVIDSKDWMHSPNQRRMTVKVNISDSGSLNWKMCQMHSSTIHGPCRRKCRKSMAFKSVTRIQALRMRSTLLLSNVRSILLSELRGRWIKLGAWKSEMKNHLKRKQQQCRRLKPSMQDQSSGPTESNLATNQAFYNYMNRKWR